MEKGLLRDWYWAVAKDDDVKEVKDLLKQLRIIDRRLTRQIRQANATHLVVCARLKNSISNIPDKEAQNVLAWRSLMLTSAKQSIFHRIGDVESSLDMTTSCNCGSIIEADLNIDIDSSG